MNPQSPFDVMLGVPADCSGRFVGCQLMPRAMRDAGIVDALGVDDGGDLNVSIGNPGRDPDTGVIGIDDLLEMSGTVRDSVLTLLADGHRPLVIGGDCTALIGIAAAVGAARSDPGLLFVDGHLDCYDGATSPTGEGADVELAVLLGIGAERLVTFNPRRPAFAPDRVVVLGPCDEAEAAAHGAPDPRQFAPEMRIVVGEELATDPVGHAEAALTRLGSAGDGFWLHVDLDVLSGEVFPAVDYRDPRGLDLQQLTDLLRPVLASRELLGASIVILNPTLDDAKGTSARHVVDVLAKASATAC